MLVAAENIPDAVCRRPPRHYVIRRGRIVARQGHFVGLDEPAS
jgi:hypothetical protein